MREEERRKRNVCTLTSFCSVRDSCLRKDLFVCNKMNSNLLIMVLLILFPNVLLLPEEKLQVMTTKKVENCLKRSKIGDTLYMQYTVSLFD